ncbi:MAG: indole-3-glycerol phosphate synthase TrpC [Candidatus Omnitrophica bacterium]|nr:indole-3-glycerol phosphate synthase TrpC [Candidatus Omnitrophota bacterium]
MNNFLSDIVAHKKKQVEASREFYGRIKARIDLAQYKRYSVFKNAISKPGRINLIAEIKKASPSLGLIREDFKVLDIAKIYSDNGADAFSILTEDKYFLGKPAYVRQVADQLRTPILRKDFIIDEGQIYETQYIGASAILLIVAILTDIELKHFIFVAHQLDLDCLVEVHDESELDRALKCGAEIIGINNRDLKSFVVDLNVCERLIPKIPRDKIIVAESGIKNYEDVLRVQQAGAHAVLIGEVFMRAADIGAKVRELIDNKE